MGVEINDAVMVVVPDYVTSGWWQEMTGAEPPDVQAFRDSIPDEYRPLLVGPVPHVINGGHWWVFGPDGSKEGWDTSNEAEEWRSRFMALFDFMHADGSSPYEIVHVRWGGDQAAGPGAVVAYANDYAHDAVRREAYDRDIAGSAGGNDATR